MAFKSSWFAWRARAPRVLGILAQRGNKSPTGGQRVRGRARVPEEKSVLYSERSGSEGHFPPVFSSLPCCTFLLSKSLSQPISERSEV